MWAKQEVREAQRAPQMCLCARVWRKVATEATAAATATLTAAATASAAATVAVGVVAGTQFT